MVTVKEESTLGQLSLRTPNGNISDHGLSLRNRKRAPVRAGELNCPHRQLTS